MRIEQSVCFLMREVFNRTDCAVTRACMAFGWELWGWVKWRKIPRFGRGFPNPARVVWGGRDGCTENWLFRGHHYS